MSTQDEARDLILNPVPELAIRDPLTRVYAYDNQIAELETALSRMKEERQAALNYAVKNNIAEEGEYRIEEKYRKTRTLNIEKFKSVFPEVYMTCCDVERRDLEQKLEHLGEKINLTLIDKLIKPVALEAAPGVVLVKETITYNVVRKC
jgi:hypothetical protein